jgi:hypothetical protein
MHLRERKRNVSKPTESEVFDRTRHDLANITYGELEAELEPEKGEKSKRKARRKPPPRTARGLAQLWFSPERASNRLPHLAIFERWAPRTSNITKRAATDFVVIHAGTNLDQSPEQSVLIRVIRGDDVEKPMHRQNVPFRYQPCISVHVVT